LRIAGERILGHSKPVKPLGWFVADWHDYLRLIQKVQGEKSVGEATPAPPNIQARLMTAST